MQIHRKHILKLKKLMETKAKNYIWFFSEILVKNKTVPEFITFLFVVD